MTARTSRWPHRARRRPSFCLLACVVGALTIGFCAPLAAETVLITGANSGLGLEFSKQYAAKGWTVIATHRRDEIPQTLAELSSMHANVRVEKMDVTNHEQVSALAQKLRGEPIDVLINNAGLRCLCDWMEKLSRS